MKIFTNKEMYKKIIIAILLVMSFNFITPIVSKATVVEDTLFKPISSLLCMISDLVIKGLQYYFMGDGDIMVENPLVQNGETYYIEYSPGMIFSNKIAGLDVNFFNPGENYQKTEEVSEMNCIGEKEVKSDTYTMSLNTEQEEEFKGKIEDAKNKLLEEKGYESSIVTEYSDFRKFDDIPSDSYANLTSWTWEYQDNRYYYAEIRITDMNGGNNVWFQKIVQMRLYEENRNTLLIGEEIESSASELQPIVATWYKTLRAIALVGLLSVLVYVGIRIIISSTGQEKAKYKKMIGNWLAAICILFVLQYIMIFTLEITQKITDVLSVNIIGEHGEDTLMSGLRYKVKKANTFEECFPQLLMYMVLVIYTVMFTIQYLKRLLYMAFFTMIAPLIALTYPLDKIKDGQAQAFTTWIREYIFNALLQPMHLLLYYIFVGSATNLVNVDTGNPLYAVVAIGFLLPAEKFFRKMFGFDKAQSSSQIGAAAGGALVMNAINKMGQKSGKQAAEGSEKGTTVRMASSNGVQIGSGNGRTNQTPGGANPQPGTPSPAPGGANPDPGTPNPAPGGANPDPGTPNPAPGGANPDPGNPNPAPGGANPDPGNPNPAPGGANPPSPTPGGFGTTREANTHGPTMLRAIDGYVKRGFGAVGRRYINKNTAKKVGKMARRGALGALGAATLGTVGLAAGIATGDLGNALKYGAAGAGAGYYGANRLGDKVVAGEKNIRETFKEGAIGQNEYNNLKADKQFYQSDEFRSMLNNQDLDENLLNNMGATGKNRDAKLRNAVQVYRDSGVTDTGKISTAMKAGLKPEEGAYAIKLAGMIGRSGWNNPNTRKDFETRYKSQIPGNSGDKIWNSIESLL